MRSCNLFVHVISDSDNNIVFTLTNEEGYLIEDYSNYSLKFRLKVKREIAEYTLGSDNCVVGQKQDYVYNDGYGKVRVPSTYEGAVLETIPCIIISIPSKTFKSEGVVEMSICNVEDSDDIWSNWSRTKLKMIQL